jgi:hypothetical protein
MIDTKVEGFDSYCVSHRGFVYKIVNGKKLICKIGRSKHGYDRVFLRKDNKSKQFYLHRILAKAFIPNPENKKTVNHINGIRSDNRLENLEWCTPKENTTHAISIGLFNPRLANRKLSDTQIMSLLSMPKHNTGDCFNYNQVAKEWEVSPSAISLIRSGKRKPLNLD